MQVQHEYPQPLVEPRAGGGCEIPGFSAVFKGVAGLLASVKGQNIAVLSEQHREWMKEFQAEEQNSDMEPNSMSL